MSERSFAGYTLDELEKLCMDRAAARTVGELTGPIYQHYQQAALAALPFLIARIRQLDRRSRYARERERRQEAG